MIYLVATFCANKVKYVNDRSREIIDFVNNVM